MSRVFSSIIAGMMILLLPPLTMAQSTVTMETLDHMNAVALGFVGQTFFPSSETIISYAAANTIVVIASDNPIIHSIVT